MPRHVYVHVPFCTRRCTYCDFSIAVRKATPVEDFVEGISRELALRSESFMSGNHEEWTIDTLYLGGGTPSRLGGAGVNRVLDIIRQHLRLDQNAELTLEANPEDVTSESAEAWRAAGVNRLSIGAQSFDDGVLRWMHRVHDAQQTRRALIAARNAGFENISLDLIFALPETVQRSWTRDLDEALSVGPDHISLYGLTIEPTSPLGRQSQRLGGVVQNEERYAVEFLEAHNRMAAAGFEHYEVSNFAKPGFRSRHNFAYWSGAAYVGIGPAAHSYDGSTRSWNVPAYADWLKRLRGGSSVIGGSEQLSTDEHATESAYLGLRTLDGYRVSDRNRPLAKLWQSAGWATLDDSTLRLNPEGWLRLDALASGLTVS